MSPLVYTRQELDQRLAIIEDRYPLGPPAEYSREEIKVDLDLAWQLVKLIRQEVELNDAQADAKQERAP